jgi:hypothetical protein
MHDETNEHFFACNFLWWSLRVSFGRPELSQAGELAERFDEYDHRLEDLGEWLMDELLRAGRAYTIDGQKQGISHIDPVEIEQRLTSSLRALEDLAASAAPSDESRAYCMYDAECSWVVAILRAFVDIEQSFSGDDVRARYREAEGMIADLIMWLRAQRDEVASKQIPVDSLMMVRDKTEPIIDAAARAWRDEVRAYSTRYPRS